jgi:tRNA (guanosine-2'-O-)-methyltransferase
MTPERYEKLKQILQRRQPDLTVLMEDVHKPRNFAAIIRSCDAVGCLETHAIAPEGIPFNRPKAAAGSRRWVKTKKHNDLESAYDFLQQKGFKIVVAHPSDNATDFREYDYTQPTALVMGSELNGLSDEAIKNADHAIVIPMQGMVQSLNVSVSAALILYEAERQRQNAGMYKQQRIDDDIYARLLFEWSWPKIAHLCRMRKIDYPKMNLETGELVGEVPR